VGDAVTAPAGEQLRAWSSARVPWRLSRRRLTPYLVAAILAVLLWGYVVQPMLATASGSIAGGVHNYTRYLSGDGVAQRALVTTLGIAFASVLTCGVTGVGVALLFRRFDFPGRRLLESVVLVPAALPPLIGAIAFSLLYGRSGILPRALQVMVGASSPPISFDGISGVLIMHAFTMYPFFALAATAAMAGFDHSLEEAAANLGASRLRVWRTVLLPMLTPALVSGSLLVFMVSMASYTAPLLFGVSDVLTVQIYQDRSVGQYASADAHSTVLAFASVCFLLVLRWYERRRSFRSVSKGAGVQRHTVRSRPARLASLLAAIVATVILVAPALTILLVSFVPEGTWTTQVLPPQYTLLNYRALSHASVLQPVLTSLKMSAMATAACLLVGVAIAYATTRLRFIGRTALDVASMLPWALPGTVVGINLIQAFNKPSGFDLGTVLVGTFWIVPLAYFVRFMPLVFRSSAASLTQLDSSMEEAASNLGAGWWLRFRTVVLPLIWRGILAGALLAFIHGFGEFVASVLIYTPSSTPMSVAIYNQLYQGDFGAAAAYGALQVLLIFVVMLATRRIEGRAETRELIA